MLQVTVYEEGEPARVERFGEADRVSFGRAPENDLILRHNSISRAHGEFCFEDGHWNVLDRGSRSGMIIVRGPRREHLGGGLENSRAELHGSQDILILGTRLRIDVLDEANASLQRAACSQIAETQLAEVPIVEHPALKESRQLELLLDLAKDLNGVNQLEAVLARVSQAVFAALDHATQVSICVPAPSGAFRPELGFLRDGTRLRPDAIALSSSIVERVVENESAMLFQTGDEDCDATQSMIARAITSSMAVPLLGARGPSGVMVVDNRTLGSSFAESDLDLMIMLANSAAFALERAQLQTQIEVMFDGFVDTAVSAIEARDPTTSGHSRRVAALTVCLAEAVSDCKRGEWERTHFDQDGLTELAYSALLHDFGKVGISECLLGKAEKLHPEQLDAIEARFALIESSSETAMLREVLHERAGAQPETQLDAVAQQLAPLRDELASLRGLIRELSRGDTVDEDAIARVRQLGARSFTDLQGNAQPFLTPYEIESLDSGAGTLTPQQRSEIERHVTLSFEVVRQIPWPSPLSRVPDLVHAHHEKLDGSGYPRGLRGSEIPVEARILTLCDMFDAVTAYDRPYRAALPLDAGLEFLRWEAGAGRLDCELVELFVEQRVFEARPTPAQLQRLLRVDA